MKNVQKTKKAVYFLSVALLGSFGCANKLARRQNPVPPSTDQTTGTANQAAADENAEPSVRNAVFYSAPELHTVRFAYNSAELSAETRSTLQSNAVWLKSRPDLLIQVAGNCDQRGTVDYNLALGQKRAAAVRNYYGMIGVEPSRVATISYGKEKLLCRQSTESCWRRNRRAETLVSYPLSVSQRQSGTGGAGN